MKHCLYNDEIIKNLMYVICLLNDKYHTYERKFA